MLKREEKIRKIANLRQRGIIVFEDIYDPHNAAAVLRTAEALGFLDIYFIFEKQKYFNPRKVGKKSSSSANKWLNFKIFKSTKKCYQELKSEGYMIYATVLDDNAESIFNVDLSITNIAIVFGNEHVGISEYGINNADKLITIPLSGMVQSLNLSVAAGIFLYEIVRQRKLTNKDYSFSKKIKEKLSIDYLKR